jgi:hypothetical protein
MEWGWRIGTDELLSGGSEFIPCFRARGTRDGAACKVTTNLLHCTVFVKVLKVFFFDVQNPYRIFTRSARKDGVQRLMTPCVGTIRARCARHSKDSHIKLYVFPAFPALCNVLHDLLGSSRLIHQLLDIFS